MSYPVRLRTKNPSALELRSMIREVRSDRPVVVRLGSRTPLTAIFPRSHSRAIEINSIEGISNSRDKRLMKECFDRGQVKTADWWAIYIGGYDFEGIPLIMKSGTGEPALISYLPYPVIIKHVGSHGGGGIFLIENQEALDLWKSTHSNLSSYIIEEYKNFSKEYRLHVTKDGCFYSCRKMLKSDATERWHRHDINSVWILEENPLFERPKNWPEIEAECVKALNAVGLDFGACDVKVQTEKGKNDSFIPDFIVMEINSAPSISTVGTQKYFEKLKEIIENATRK